MDTSDGSNGMRYQAFDTRPDTEFKLHPMTWHALADRPWRAERSPMMIYFPGTEQWAAVGPHNIFRALFLLNVHRAPRRFRGYCAHRNSIKEGSTCVERRGRQSLPIPWQILLATSQDVGKLSVGLFGQVYSLKDRDQVGLSAGRSVGFIKCTVLIGRTGLSTWFSVPDSTLSLSKKRWFIVRLLLTWRALSARH